MSERLSEAPSAREASGVAAGAMAQGAGEKGLTASAPRMKRSLKSLFANALVRVIEIVTILAIFLTYIKEIPSPFAYLLTPVILYFLGVFVATLVHELGHAIGAWLSGWRVLMIRVWPIVLHVPSRSVFVLRKAASGPRVGFVTSVPARREVVTIRRWLVIVAGGPLASLVFAVGLAIAGFLFSRIKVQPFDATPPDIALIVAICVGFCVQSLAFCITALIPRRTPTFNSDGYRLLNARHDPLRISNRDAQPWLQQIFRYHVRPREIPQWMVDPPAAAGAEGRALQAQADMFEVARMLDAVKPDPAAARLKLDAYRQAYGESEWLCACDAYVAAMYEGDVERAERLLAIPHDAPVIPELALAARAAVSARRGERLLMMEQLRKMDEALKMKTPFKDACYSDIRRQVEGLFQANRVR